VRVGLDFDGVIADTIPAMILYARQHVGLELEPRDCVMPGGVARLGLAVYRHLVEVTHATSYALTFGPTAGALEAIPELARHHDLFVVTARSKESFANAEQWLDQRGLSACFVSVYSSGGPAKSEVVEALGLDCFVDDAPRTFEGWRSTARPVLWHTDYNESHHVTPPMIRVRDWTELSVAAGRP
jgi:5'(3')-deoxyribonucleotidase